MKINPKDPFIWATATIILGFLGLSGLPILLTQTQFIQGLSFGKPNEIGDTIGGTVGPFISLIGSILLYISILEQRKYNKKVYEEIERQNNISSDKIIVEKIEKELELISKKTKLISNEISFYEPFSGKTHYFKIGTFLFFLLYNDFKLWLLNLESFMKYVNEMDSIFTKIERCYRLASQTNDPHKSIYLEDLKNYTMEFTMIKSYFKIKKFTDFERLGDNTESLLFEEYIKTLISISTRYNTLSERLHKSTQEDKPEKSQK